MCAARQLRRWVCGGAAALVLGVGVAAATGCGTEVDSLSESDIKAELQKLGFTYRYRDVPHSGDGAVVAGLARDDGHATYFAVISGHPEIKGRVVPRQRLPNGGFQKGVDSTQGPGYVTKFFYTHTSTPRASSEIDFAMCVAARGSRERCVD